MMEVDKNTGHAHANKRREKAEECRGTSQCKKAILYYLQALAYIDHEAQSTEANHIKIPIYMAIAECCKELGAVNEIITYATEAIVCGANDEFLLELLVLRANAYENKGMLTQAMKDWKRVKKLQPSHTIPKDLKEIIKSQELVKTSNAIRGIQNKLKEYKEKGNAYYKERRYLKAIGEYTRGIRLLLENCNVERLKDLPEEYLVTICNLYNNRAICSLVLGRHLDVIDDAGFVIAKLDPINRKAHFRRCKALRSLGNYENALADLQKAFRFDNDNQEIKKKLKETFATVAEEKRKKFIPKPIPQTQEEFGKPRTAHHLELVHRFCKDTPKKLYQYLTQHVDPSQFSSLLENTKLNSNFFFFIISMLGRELQE